MPSAPANSTSTAAARGPHQFHHGPAARWPHGQCSPQIVARNLCSGYVEHGETELNDECDGRCSCNRNQQGGARTARGKLIPYCPSQFEG